MYASLLESIFPAFFAFYMGAWCDMFGRKLILYLYFTCTILKQICVIICAYFLESPKEYLLFAGIPESLAGGKAAFFLAINAFMSDITGKFTYLLFWIHTYFEHNNAILIFFFSRTRIPCFSFWNATSDFGLS